MVCCTDEILCHMHTHIFRKFFEDFNEGNSLFLQIFVIESTDIIPIER